jgi:group I intron endonuclease
MFLLFDLEILLVYPYSVSSYNNSSYGLTVVIIFILLLTVGFVYEIGKGALKIKSKQTGYLESSTFPSSPTKRFYGRSKPKNLYTWPLQRRSYSTQNTTANEPTVPVRTYPNFDLDKVKILLDNRRKSGVYRLKNLTNGKTYVGSSVNISYRLSKYYSLTSLVAGSSMLINRALLKYGYSSFSFEILEYCGKDETLKRENYYLELLKPDYNIATDTLAPMLGRKHSAETLEKLRAINTGRTVSEEARAKISASQKGRKLAEEVKAKMGLGRTGEKNHRWGKILTIEERAVLKLSQPGRIGIEITDLKTKSVTNHTSIREAANYLGIARSTVSNYLASNKPYLERYLFKKQQLKKGDSS